MLTKDYTKTPVALDRLFQEIDNSTITIAIEKSETYVLGDQLTVTFKTDLSEAEWTTMDGIVSSHSGEPLIAEDIQQIIGEVTPTAPKNEYDLKPYGLGHKHIDASANIFDITLSNKSGMDIDYSGDEDPQFYDCIEQDGAQVRDGVASIDGSTITTFLGRLSNGTGKLCRPIDIDYTVEISEDVDVVYLWGIFFEALDYGDDDIIRLQVIDDTGFGIAAGLYDEYAAQYEMTATEFYNYMCSQQGGVFILKEYDECWVRQLSKIIELDSPDGSPGEIPVHATLRIKYYPKDETKTAIRVWSDYKITIKE